MQLVFQAMTLETEAGAKPIPNAANHVVRNASGDFFHVVDEAVTPAALPNCRVEGHEECEAHSGVLGRDVDTDIGPLRFDRSIEAARASPAGATAQLRSWFEEATTTDNGGPELQTPDSIPPPSGLTRPFSEFDRSTLTSAAAEVPGSAAKAQDVADPRHEWKVSYGHAGSAFAAPETAEGAWPSNSQPDRLLGGAPHGDQENADDEPGANLPAADELPASGSEGRQERFPAKAEGSEGKKGALPQVGKTRVVNSDAYGTSPETAKPATYSSADAERSTTGKAVTEPAGNDTPVHDELRSTAAGQSVAVATDFGLWNRLRSAREPSIGQTTKAQDLQTYRMERRKEDLSSTAWYARSQGPETRSGSQNLQAEPSTSTGELASRQVAAHLDRPNAREAFAETVLLPPAGQADTEELRNQGISDKGRVEPAVARSVVNQVIQTVIRAPGENAVELRLQPEELGRVRLTMTPIESGVSIQVWAERSETLDLLRRNIELLESDLKRQGFSSMSFSFGSETSDNAPMYHEDRARRAGPGHIVSEDMKPGLLIETTSAPSHGESGRLDIRI